MTTRFWGMVLAVCVLAGVSAQAANRQRQSDAVWSYTRVTGVVNSTAVIAVDLSNTAAPWPHKSVQAANIQAYRIEVDKVAAGTGTVKVGVITSVNASSGTVSWLFTKEISKNVSNTSNVEVANFYPAALNAYVNASGQTPEFITQDVVPLTDTEALEYQNDVALPTSQTGGTPVPPAKGDIILRVQGGGSTNTTNVSLGLLYFTIP